MGESAFDEEFLFSNFDSANEDDTTDHPGGGLKSCTATMTKELGTSDNTGAQDKYISELEEQNAKLKSIIKRMLGPQMFSRSESILPPALNEDGEIDLIQKLEDDIHSKPFAIVMFLNNDVSTVHRKEIDEMMKNVSEKPATQEVLMAQKLQAQNSAVPVKAFTANYKGRRCNPSKNKDAEDPYILCACQYFKSFFIDRMGAPLLENNPGVTDLWDVPLYQQIFLKALPILEEALNVRVKQIKQCFNCGGEHHLNDCTLPKDMQRINLSRKQHSASKFNSPGRDSRYHINDEDVDERFKHFKPGQISVGLEEALGISLDTQLPPYIYMMRKLGYPPGWLKPSDEGLKMYGAEGNIIEEPGIEEGEIKPINIPDVVNYPGFNAAMPEGVQDVSRDMGMPPFQPESADLDIARKRAKILGYSEREPLAKRLKYDDALDMEVENENGYFANGKPPLPLIEVTADTIKPPSPENTLVSEDVIIKAEPVDDDAINAENGTIATSSSEKDNESKKDTTTPARRTSVSNIDETTYRHWFMHPPLTSVGITYVMYTPPPTCKGVVDFNNLPKNPILDLDREPWRTASASWYDPLYGDLAAPTGTYDSIRTLLKETKREKRKPLI
ncbi:zinc finger CCHC domain-containing protein 8-like [Hydractinia symbiolongicarpus]|uniref:zinc finger CCHC domain-containing protein 8-like n=1 Tax=Hydractinia symbiolongicarpus TaxID=13093 RepID=UPI00254BF8CC|nr:zinc finger CCHC domain-containing protein 8-like [Hydractinia symbiolongicarpus]